LRRTIGIPNLKGKTTNRRTPKLIDDDRIHLGMALNASKTSLNGPKELLSQARLSPLIPIIGRSYIIVSIRCENNAFNHAASVRDA
jgi:hypothetical protein